MANRDVSPEYRAYITSDAWKAKRADALASAGYRCQSCKRRYGEVTLQVHHKHYERLGEELPGDLEVYCTECHPYVDDERRIMAPLERMMTNARAWAEQQIGADAMWVYDDQGKLDGITEAGLEALDEYRRRFGGPSDQVAYG